MRKTIFSKDRLYRYTLWREWDNELFNNYSGYVQFIGLNPSTADETNNDPTIIRCIGFAKLWGCAAICMTNIFAWRDTLPENMRLASDPIGVENNKHLIEVSIGAKFIVAAWGNHGDFLNRGNEVKEILNGKLLCLGKTANGSPRHPLYLNSKTELELYK